MSNKKFNNKNVQQPVFLFKTGNKAVNSLLYFGQADRFHPLSGSQQGGFINEICQVSAGETETLSLYIDTTGASSANDDSLRVDIDSEANVNAGVNAGTDAIEWDDDGEAADIDGDLVKNLPVTGGTIVY